jgi:predicted dehydrogenase
LVHHIRACPNTEIAGFADVYARRLETAAGATPGATIHSDYRSLLEDPNVDAVIIATPQHLHAQQFCDAIAAGKHVYLEKAMALSVAQAKAMRAVYEGDRRRHVVQIGHQACSTGHVTDVHQFLSRPDRMGKITAIAMQMHRNTPVNKAQWARPALLTTDLTPDRLDWSAFLGDAPPREFDPNRFVHWRYFWDYSGGSVFEHMSQQLSFWYGTLNLDIPQSATMKGGIYLWKDGRQVPDTVSVTLQQPEEILVSWVSGLGNNQLGVTEDVLGTHGSITRASQVRYVPQKVNRPDLQEAVGRSAHTPQAHLQNFLDCVRLGGEPNCPFELGYRVSIACRMAVDSYREGRTVRWDSQREEIV